MFCCSVPLKQWKCSFEETFQLQCISHWLQEMAAMFAESRFFHLIREYIATQHDVPVVIKNDSVQEIDDKTVSAQLTSCDDNKVIDVSRLCDMSNAESSLIQNCTELLNTDMQLTDTGRLTEHVDSSTTVDNDLSLTDTAALTAVMDILKERKSEGQRKRTRQRSASKTKQVDSSRESTKSKPVPHVSDNTVDKTLNVVDTNSAGNLHCFVSFSR